uniref:Uncharacterized protein n=1 Tax=Oryza meridionalis TaxID=40149 RepID=A0A0E0C2A1_9ORYZ
MGAWRQAPRRTSGVVRANWPGSADWCDGRRGGADEIVIGGGADRCNGWRDGGDRCDGQRLGGGDCDSGADQCDGRRGTSSGMARQSECYWKGRGGQRRDLWGDALGGRGGCGREREVRERGRDLGGRARSGRVEAHINGEESTESKWSINQTLSRSRLMDECAKNTEFTRSTRPSGLTRQQGDGLPKIGLFGPASPSPPLIPGFGMDIQDASLNDSWRAE